MIGKPTGELETGFGRRVVADQLRIATPAYLYPGIQIGFGTSEAVQARRLEAHSLAKDFDVRRKGDAGATAVGRRPDRLQLRRRQTARKGLAVQGAIPRDLDHRVGR